MRRSLILIPWIAILVMPGVSESSQARADAPSSQIQARIDSLSPPSDSFPSDLPDRHTDFHYRFVTYLPDDLRPENAVTRGRETTVRVGEAVESASAGEDHHAAEEGWSDGARLAMRLAELNKPAALLTISVPPPQVGDTPVNQAAEIFDEAPNWIRGHQGFAPPARRVHMAFYHNPTYYQELNLERCGQLDCERCGYLQNLSSSVRFIGNTSLLPYRLASQPPCDCVLSYGDCPTCHDYDCPVEPLQLGESCAPTRRGLLSQSAALAGFVLLLW